MTTWSRILLLFVFVTLCTIEVVAQEDPDVRQEGDAGEYDALQEILDELTPEQKLDALQDYLDRHPKSVHRPEIEQRILFLQSIETLDASPTTELSATPRKSLHAPPGFTPIEPIQSLRVFLVEGTPSWKERLVFYSHPLSSDFVLGGRVGQTEGQRLIEAQGHYTLARTPRNNGILTAMLALRGELGQDSRLQTEARIGYGGTLGPIELQAFVAPRLRLTGAFDVRYQAGIGIGAPFREHFWFGIETTGYLKPVAAIRPDLAEPLSTLVGFFALAIEACYQVTPDLEVQISMSLPEWYRYRRDYELYFGAGLSYHFGAKKKFERR